MPWFEAHDTMARHPKTLKLARLLGVDRRYAVGLLHDLFSWGLYAAQKDGELPDMTQEDIAQALDWPAKKTDALITALTQSGYLEQHTDVGGPTGRPVYSIHDWYDYAGKLFEKRAKDRERMREARANKGQKG